MAVTKRGERVMTAVGAVVGFVVGLFLLLRITSHRTVSAGFFTLAVFIAGIAGMIIYVGVKDGIGALLKRASGKTAAPGAVSGVDSSETEREAAVVDPEPEPETQPEPVKTTPAAKKRRPQLRATLPPEPDDEDDEPKPTRRPVSTRQRPLRPRD